MIEIKRVFHAVLLAAAMTGPVWADGETVIVETHDFKFKPAELTVKVGTTVRWLNTEKRQYHSVWFRELGEEPGEYFFPEEYVERTFDKPGTYHYVCEPHEKSDGMKGVIHVVE